MSADHRTSDPRSKQELLRQLGKAEKDAYDFAGEMARQLIQIDKLRDLSRHLRHCRSCGETDVSWCFEGSELWNAAMPAEEAVKHE